MWGWCWHRRAYTSVPRVCADQGVTLWGFGANTAFLLHRPSKAETTPRVKNRVCCSPAGRTGVGRGTEHESSLGGTPGLVPLLLPGKNPSLGYTPLLPPSSDTHTESETVGKLFYFPPTPSVTPSPWHRPWWSGAFAAGRLSFTPRH